MERTEMLKIATALETQPKSAELVSWGEWWEQWGEEVFDQPSALVDLESYSIQQ